MRIQSSSVEMASASLSYRKSSFRTGSFLQNMNTFSGQQEEEPRKVLRGGSLRPEFEPSNRQVAKGSMEPKDEMSPSDEYTLRFMLFRRILELILKGGSLAQPGGYGQSGSVMKDGSLLLTGLSSGGYSVFRRVVTAEYSIEEHQETSFESQGLVKTEDGRKISFGISFSMSRTMSERFEAVASMPFILTDPLVINLSDSVTQVGDKKFFFDLDADGEEEELHFAAEGSGFLTLDRNGDGEINDGTELFGAGSGDGFRDLAVFDKDGNGWIDENDDVYSRLRVWTKDSDGNDVMLTLKDADVGAIYLGSAETGFSLYADENEDDGTAGEMVSAAYAGELRRSGFYLRESSGAPGMINQVDLASRAES